MSHESERSETRRRRGLTRRQTLGAAGAAGAGLLFAGVGGGVAGLVGDDRDEAIAKQAKSCLRLAAEQEEGPFYVDLEKVRADIVEGQAGVPLDLRIRVIDHEKCEPVKNAAVDIWQCNAYGVYSDEESEGTVGQTYLRGVQFTDADGWAELKTIYPGHYEGRATHIHVKVHIGGKRTAKTYSGGHVCHTGQMLFHESVTDKVYETAPYNQSTVARVPNAQDRIYSQQGGKRSMPRLSGDPESGIAATIAFGIDPSATPNERGPTSEAPPISPG
jgi:protocatechuate 3,4-dioxygenase beta subunit